MTDDNISDHDKQEESSSDEFEDSDMDSNGSVCVDDVIKCNCDQLEEQGFMIQVHFQRYCLRFSGFYHNWLVTEQFDGPHPLTTFILSCPFS